MILIVFLAIGQAIVSSDNCKGIILDKVDKHTLVATKQPMSLVVVACICKLSIYFRRPKITKASFFYQSVIVNITDR
jgi:hypothetical protein